MSYLLHGEELIYVILPASFISFCALLKHLNNFSLLSVWTLHAVVLFTDLYDDMMVKCLLKVQALHFDYKVFEWSEFMQLREKYFDF